MTPEFVMEKLSIVCSLMLLAGGPVALYELYKFETRRRFERRLAAKRAYAAHGIDNGDPITEADRPFRLPWE